MKPDPIVNQKRHTTQQTQILKNAFLMGIKNNESDNLTSQYDCKFNLITMNQNEIDYNFTMKKVDFNQSQKRNMIDFFVYYDPYFVLIFEYDQNGKTTLRDLLK